MTDNDIINNEAVVEASELPGEEAVDCNVDNISYCGGGNHFVHILLKFATFLSGHGAGNDFLDPSRVELFDKRSIFGFETTTNRYSFTRGFQNVTLLFLCHTTTRTRRIYFKEKVNLEGIHRVRVRESFVGQEVTRSDAESKECTIPYL